MFLGRQDTASVVSGLVCPYHQKPASAGNMLVLALKNKKYCYPSGGEPKWGLGARQDVKCLVFSLISAHFKIQPIQR